MTARVLARVVIFALLSALREHASNLWFGVMGFYDFFQFSKDMSATVMRPFSGKLHSLTSTQDAKLTAEF